MKKGTLAIALAIICALSLIRAIAIHANDGINVTINGQRVNFNGQGPVVVDGRTLVPVRGVFEALGFHVEWDGNARQATLTSAGHVVKLIIGSTSFTTNDEPHTLDVSAQMINGSTMLPIRAVLESVGYYLDWNGVARTVIISDQPIPAQSGQTPRLADAYAAYLNILNEKINEFGIAESAWLFSDTPGVPRVGVTYAALIDFDDNGIPELFIVFHDGSHDMSSTYVEARYVIYGFTETLNIIREGISFFNENDGTSLNINLATGRNGTIYLLDVNDRVTEEHGEYYQRQAIDWLALRNGRFVSVMTTLADSGSTGIEVYVNDNPVSLEEFNNALDNLRRAVTLWSTALQAFPDDVNAVLTRLRAGV